MLDAIVHSLILEFYQTYAPICLPLSASRLPQSLLWNYFATLQKVSRAKSVRLTRQHSEPILARKTEHERVGDTGANLISPILASGKNESPELAIKPGSFLAPKSFDISETGVSFNVTEMSEDDSLQRCASPATSYVVTPVFEASDSIARVSEVPGNVYTPKRTRSLFPPPVAYESPPPEVETLIRSVVKDVRYESDSSVVRVTPDMLFDAIPPRQSRMSTPPLTPNIYTAPVQPKNSTPESIIESGTGPYFESEIPLVAQRGFERLALSHPNLRSIEESDGRYVSYAKLNSMSNNIARDLLRRGVKKGMYVAVISTSCVEMIAGVLGTLKSGAAFIPIDSAIPPSRINFILETAGCEFALALSSFDRSSLKFEVEYVDLEVVADCDPIDAHVEFPEPEPNDPAYAIFTSGSTGKPKGVVLSHSNLSNFIYPSPNLLRARLKGRVGQLASPSFDMFVCEIFCTLSKGACLVVKRQNDPMSITQKVDTILLTPTLLSKLDPATHRNIKLIISGGESLSKTLAAKWVDQAAIINGYGPTEITMACTSSLVSMDREIAIGRALPNYKLYIVDSKLRLAPYGTDGELLVGGPGVALGYLGRPDLTSQRFIPDHFSNDGSRMYRTGDICKWSKLGELLFLGRVDDMVKINGYRIELEEVTSSLTNCDGVNDAVVIAKDNSLLAFVTPMSLDADSVRQEVLSTLPHYMCPSTFIKLESLPLNSNQKADKRKLMDLYMERRKAQNQSLPALPSPMSETEQSIRNIWVKMLKVDESLISPDTTFFDIGGDSMNSLVLLSKLSEITDMKLSLTSIYKYQSLRALAGVIDANCVQESSTIEWTREIQDIIAQLKLPSQLECQSLEAAGKNGPIVLTGATGFLGAHLLRDLLVKTKSNVICLAVRAGSELLALSRVLEAMEKYGLYDAKHVQHAVNQGRVVAYRGNLDDSRFGLTESQYTVIQMTASAVYHVGASVNHLKTYYDMKKANVESLEWILGIATRYSIKPIHFVSTLAVWDLGYSRSGEYGAEVYLPDVSPSSDSSLAGYAASKWASELVLSWAAEAVKVPVKIYRPSYITGHTTHGICNGQGSLDLLIKACIRLKMFPRLSAEFVDMIPVDYCTRAIVDISLQAVSETPDVYHLSNPNSLSWHDIFSKLCHSVPGLRDVEVSEFKTALESMEEYIAVLSLLPSDATAFTRPFRSANTQRVAGGGYHRLFGTNQCPKISSKLLKLYVEKSWKM